MMMIIYDHHLWWSYMSIRYDDHTWSLYMMIIHDHHIWSSYMIIIYDDTIGGMRDWGIYNGLPFSVKFGPVKRKNATRHIRSSCYERSKFIWCEDFVFVEARYWKSIKIWIPPFVPKRKAFIIIVIIYVDHIWWS